MAAAVPLGEAERGSRAKTLARTSAGPGYLNGHLLRLSVFNQDTSFNILPPWAP
jgi:hypothetical protein